MRRALPALALLCAVAVSGSAAAGGTSTVVDPDCELTSRVAEDRDALSFRFGCANIEPHELELWPTTGVRGVTHHPVVKPRDPYDRFYCPRLHRGRGVRCTGHMEDGATLKGRLDPEGPLCRTEIRWNVVGGVDCDGDQVCAAIALGDRGRTARPRGC